MRWIRPYSAVGSVAACALALLLLGPVVDAQPEAPGANYRIGARDQLQVRVRELPEASLDLQVANDGTIDVPMVGNLPARGSTTAQLQELIRTRLESQGLRQATVTVKVIGFHSRPVSVLGAVQAPGKITLTGSMPLLDVLLEAGGLQADHGATITVRRRSDNGLDDSLEIDVDDLMRRGDPLANIPILAGDLINVSTATGITIHFLGEVEATGSQTFTDGRVTLLTAIARAGGLTETAARKLRILRLQPDGERREIVVDYRRILGGRDPDLPLEDEDIVVVKESFF